MSSQLAYVKGGVSGGSSHGMRQSAGTGQLLFLNNKAIVTEILTTHVAGEQWTTLITAIGIVVVTGTITVSTGGSSLNSNGTVGIGDANHRIMRFNR
jgi:hypothetical protein